MSPDDLNAWEPQKPPSDFAERVVRAAQQGGRPSEPPAAPAPGDASHGEARRPVFRRAAAVVLLASTMAAGIALVPRLRGPAARGDVVAGTRREVRVGTRALAVLEPGAHVRWDGDAVEQSGGDVFWRVEPGARFVVHTAAADVAVKGTCFRVKLGERGEDMTRRDAAAAAAGALAGAAALVAVYEGRVAVSHAGQSVELAAGEAARADANGVRRTPGGDAEEGRGGAGAGSRDAKGASDDPLLAANANLADRVRDYRRRLDGITAEKQKLEKQLAEAEAKLGDAGARKSDYDLSQDDWKQLAKQGALRVHIPCSGPQGDFSVSPSDLNKLGLAPDDAQAIQAAQQRSNARTWGVIRPLCSQALPGVDVARLGQGPCIAVLEDLAQQKDSAGFDEVVRRVAEIEAGLQAAPAPNAGVPAVERMFLALAGESKSLETDLTQSLGPDDAKRFVYGGEGCWNDMFSNVGPREP